MRTLKILMYVVFLLGIFSSTSFGMFNYTMDTTQVAKADSIDEKIHIVVDEQPVLIGGIKSVEANLVYPQEAKDNKIEGRVIIRTTIDKEGNVLDTKVMKGIGYGCDEAAVEAVKKTKFLPGKIDGKPVYTQISFPIIFKL